MAIELPPFEETFCQFLSLCSRVSGDSIARLPQEDLDLTTAYNTSVGRALVRLIWGREDRHLHLDLALRSAFVNKPPTPDTRLPPFRKAFAEFLDTPVETNALGSYALPRSSLPPAGGLIFTGNTAIKLKVNKSEVELTGASLRFRNADVDYIRWDLLKDQVLLEVFARRGNKITDTFLRDSLAALDAAVDRHILGKKADDKTSG